MSTINGKLGLKPAGQRSMMKLPKDRALRNMVTAAVCPRCGVRHAALSKMKPDALWCRACAHVWPMEGG
jgi:hypothetical protein